MNSIVIGLTGQTGAGKTTLAAYAAEHGCHIADADMIARQVMSKGSDVIQGIAEIFGYDIIDDKGELKRKLLAERAFSTKENTEKLNRLTHAGINSLAAEYIKRYREKGGIIIYDCPLLFESGGDLLCDITVAVTVPERIRLERIMRRDCLTEREAMLRIRAQKNEEFYRSRADLVIDGSEEPEKMRSDFGELLEKIARERGVK